MFIPIKLDKMRNFRYGMRAIDRLEKSIRMPAAKMNFEEMSMEDTATFIWAGLVHEDPELTPEKVMDLIDEYSNVTEVITVAGQAFEVAFGVAKETKEVKGKNGKKAAPSA